MNSTFAKKIQDKLEELKQLDTSNTATQDSIREMETQIGVIEAGLNQLTSYDKATLTYAEIVDRVADAMEKEGYEVRNTAGIIKDEYKSSIDSVIKANSELTPILQGQSLTFNNLNKNVSKLKEATKQIGVSQEHLKELLKYATEENISEFERLATAAGYTKEEFRNLVYAADNDKLQQFADVLGKTVEELEKMQGIEMANFSDLTAKPTEIIEKFSKQSSLLSNILSSGKISNEDMQTILGDSVLTEKYVEFGGDSSKLAEYLSNNLIGVNSKGVNYQTEAYAQAVMQQYLDNNTNFDKFRMENSTLANLRKKDEKWGKIETWSQLFEILGSYSKEELQNGDLAQLQEDINKALSFSIKVDVNTTAFEAAIEYGKHLIDSEIENLQSQKEAIAQVNEERKKTLELMKAEEALENAKKEKKKVYREGIGFVWEASDEDISQAKDTLEQKQAEKEAEELQMQIDSLELQKSILERIPTIQQIEKQQKQFNSFMSNNLSDLTDGFSSDIGSMITKFASSMNQSYIQMAEFIISDESERQLELQEAKNKQAITDAEEAYVDLVKTASKIYEVTSVSEKQKILEEVAQKKKDFEELEKEATRLNPDYEMNKFSNAISALGAEKDSLTVQRRLIELNNDILQASGKVNKKEAAKELIFGTYTMADFYRDLYEYEVSSETKKELEKIGVKNATDYVKLAKEEMPMSDAFWTTPVDFYEHFATGTLSTSSAQTALINEQGTEGIITPEGTVTALPSKTGIVPADITKNLWQLGEVAPNLIANLRSVTKPIPTSQSQSVTNNDGMFIDNLSMTIYPTEDYDMDKFLAEAKAKARITRHNN